MTTLPGPAATPSEQVTTNTFTLRWLARRSALLVCILAAGIGAACCLYAFADDAGIDASLGAQSAKPHDVSAPRG